MKRFLVSVFALLFILSSVLVLYLSFNFKGDYTSSSAVSNEFCIIIDAGHGGEDGGTSAADGTLEKDINLSIAKYLKSFLGASGYRTIMLRNSDEQLGDTNLPTIRQRKVSDIRTRLKITQSYPEAIFISIHQNHYTSPKYSGTQVFYSTKSQYSKMLADSIQNSVTHQLQPENKRTTKSVGTNIYLLYNCELPAVMVECGFMSNPNESEKLKTPEYQKQIAFSIMCGIQNYLEEKDG